MELPDVAVECDGDEDDVLDDENHVEHQLPHQRRHVLQGLLAVDQQRVHLEWKAREIQSELRPHIFVDMEL